MTAQPATPSTIQDYFKVERASTLKHEYCNGHICVKDGESPDHNIIAATVSGLLHTRLRRSHCVLYASGQRVKVEVTKSFYYPDLSIVCGTPTFEEVAGLLTLTNPTLLVEVLSDTTESYDRGAKMDDYFQIASLQEYVLIWQDEPKMQRYLRQSSGEWLFAEALGEQGVLILPSVNCTLKAEEVYEYVKFDPRPVRRVVKPASE